MWRCCKGTFILRESMPALLVWWPLPWTGRAIFVHSSTMGVQLVMNHNAKKCLEDVFVMETSGPRSAYYIGALDSDGPGA